MAEETGNVKSSESTTSSSPVHTDPNINYYESQQHAEDLKHHHKEEAGIAYELERIHSREHEPDSEQEHKNKIEQEQAQNKNPDYEYMSDDRHIHSSECKRDVCKLKPEDASKKNEDELKQPQTVCDNKNLNLPGLEHDDTDTSIPAHKCSCKDDLENKSICTCKAGHCVCMKPGYRCDNPNCDCEKVNKDQPLDSTSERETEKTTEDANNSCCIDDPEHESSCICKKTNCYCMKPGHHCHIRKCDCHEVNKEQEKVCTSQEEQAGSFKEGIKQDSYINQEVEQSKASQQSKGTEPEIHKEEDKEAGPEKTVTFQEPEIERIPEQNSKQQEPTATKQNEQGHEAKKDTGKKGQTEKENEHSKDKKDKDTNITQEDEEDTSKNIRQKQLPEQKQEPEKDMQETKHDTRIVHQPEKEQDDKATEQTIVQVEQDKDTTEPTAEECKQDKGTNEQPTEQSKPDKSTTEHATEHGKDSKQIYEDKINEPKDVGEKIDIGKKIIIEQEKLAQISLEATTDKTPRGYVSIKTHEHIEMKDPMEQ